NLTHDGHLFKVIFRVYDDGVAFRYELPRYNGLIKATVLQEKSEIRIHDFETCWGMKFATRKSDNSYAYHYSYEEYYVKRSWPDVLTDDTRLLAPLMVRDKSDTYFLITEAANYGTYSVSMIEGRQTTGLFGFVQAGNSSRGYLEQVNHELLVALPLLTPWRCAIIGTTSTIAESNMVENLNPPTKLTDLSWIKPGRASWDWGGEEANNSVGLAIAKKYIDLAAKMGWEYFTLDDGWAGSSADYELKDITDYATEKGVSVILWAGQGTFTNNLYEIRRKLQEWADLGFKGIKVDFWDDDSKSMIEKYDKLIQAAADKHLVVDLHGATKPSGLRRYWPHLLTSEAVMGGEMYLFNTSMMTAVHNINLLLIRNSIGPMDYTPGDFARKNGNIKQNTTWAHQLALLTAYESGLQHYNDSPNNYANHIAEDFLKRIPAAWDETKLIGGTPDSYATIARRKGDDWFVASLSNLSRQVSLPLTFLKAGQIYYAYIYKDGSCKSEIAFDYKEVTSEQTLTIPVLATGGFTIHFSTKADYARPVVTKYEAESIANTLSSGVERIIDSKGLCSGGSQVNNLGQNRMLRFNKIAVESAGKYIITVYYMTAGDRNAMISVNGTLLGTYTFLSTGSFSGDGLGMQQFEVNLNQGNNVFQIAAGDYWSPNFDRITVQRVKEEIPTAVEAPQTESGISVYSTQQGICIAQDQNRTLSYAIFDVAGKCVASGKTSDSSCSVSLPAGAPYVVRVSAEGETVVLKVVNPR
ncbi:MAG: glycoside hydrolase family 97 catalytic domain-containing protein, partial [Bacteroidales bacterium]|nr:glycoside hydrolase family 97 catalytic domain-containing protein [Bacteroidales bacterium]